jgi:hypothetical protein
MNQQFEGHLADEGSSERRASRRRRRLIAGLVTVGVAGTVAVASAATLGGIKPTSLGADQSEIVSCETSGVSVDYVTKYDSSAAAGLGAYVVTDVTVGEISPRCAGQTMSVTLADSDGSALTEVQTVLNPSNPGNPGNPGSIAVTIPVAPTPLAHDVNRVAIVITG